jgi:hypothetical protein
MTDAFEYLDRIERWLAICDREPNKVPEVCPVGAMPRDLRGFITKGDLRALCARVRELDGLLTRAQDYVEYAMDPEDPAAGKLFVEISAALGKDTDNG